MLLFECSPNEVQDIIKTFSNGKCSDIPTQGVKLCSEIIAPTLSHYFNEFMKEGTFPDILKLGRVTPVYKNKGSKQNFNNYRPISILPIFGKIFKKTIYL